MLYKAKVYSSAFPAPLRKFYSIYRQGLQLSLRPFCHSPVKSSSKHTLITGLTLFCLFTQSSWSSHCMHRIIMDANMINSFNHHLICYSFLTSVPELWQHILMYLPCTFIPYHTLPYPFPLEFPEICICSTPSHTWRTTDPMQIYIHFSLNTLSHSHIMIVYNNSSKFSGGTRYVLSKEIFFGLCQHFYRRYMCHFHFISTVSTILFVVIANYQCITRS